MSDGEKKYSTAFTGFGFLLPDFDEDTVRHFLEKHKEAFMKAQAPEACRDAFLGDVPLKEPFSKMIDDISGEEGYGAAVAAVMVEETGFEFALYNDMKERGGDGRPKIAVRDGTNKYDLDELKEVTAIYARELSVPQYGNYIIHWFEYLDEDIMFDTEEE